MTNSNWDSSLAKSPENIEGKSVSSQGAAGLGVDMTNPEIMKVFPQSEGGDQPVVSQSGQMQFPDIWGGKSDQEGHVRQSADAQGHRHGGGRDDHRRGPGDDRQGGNSDISAGGAQGASPDGASDVSSEIGLLTTEIATLQGEINALQQLIQSGLPESSLGQGTSGSSSAAPAEGNGTTSVGDGTAANNNGSPATGTGDGSTGTAASNNGSPATGTGDGSTGTAASNNGSPATGTGDGAAGTTASTTGTSGDSPSSTSAALVPSAVASMEQADPTLATTINAASSAMTTQGFNNLENYLAVNNAAANPNLDSTLMSSALTQAGLSKADSTALQNAEIANMQSAQVLTYAQQNDPSLYKTITDASGALSSSGYGQMENYLVNSYTGDQYMDSSLMNNVLNQAGLSASDQAQLTGVLQNDMPTALASDPFAAGLQASDATMSKTLADSAAVLSSTGYQALESNVEDLYTGQTSSDAAIMSSAMANAGLSQADAGAITGVLQADLPAASTVAPQATADNGGVSTAADGTSTSISTSADGTSTSADGTSTASDGTSTAGSAATNNPPPSESSATTTDSPPSTGNASSTTTFNAGGQSLLEPPSTSSGLVTPEGSLSGDSTAYQGPIQGTTAGSNNITSDSETTGQGNGPDALQMGSESLITSMDLANGAGFQQKYGYFEADIKVEGGPNGWPGWFLESAAHGLDSNANSSEIDIMEAQTSSTIANGQTSYNAGVHLNSGVVGGPNNNPADQDAGPFVQNLPNITQGFNTYGVNWQPNDPNIEFYFDGKEVGYNKVYDTTDASPMYLVLDNGSGGWSTSDPGAQAQPMDVAWVRAYQLAPDVNSANDPNGTEGTTITDTNADDSPPVLSANNNGTATPWVNTFNTDFTQTSDYTTNSGYTNSPVPNSQNISEMNSQGAGPVPASTPDADNTPWYQPQWLVDQANTIQGVNAGMSTQAP